MYSRNLFVLDFVRRFFVSCAQISEAYAVRTLMKFGCSWRKISHKSKCKKTPRVHSKQVLYPAYPSPVHHKRRQSKAGSQCRHQKHVYEGASLDSSHPDEPAGRKHREYADEGVAQDDEPLFLHDNKGIVKQVHECVEGAADDDQYQRHAAGGKSFS